VAKKDTTLLAKKSGDHSMVRIRVREYLDMTPESVTLSFLRDYERAAVLARG
jgi:hypothetical protein